MFLSDPDKVAKDLTVTTLSKNLLRKYSLGKGVAEEEQEGETTGTETDAKPKGGQSAMTKEKKEKIKSGSLIALGCKGVL